VQTGRRVGARCCSGQGSSDVQGSSRGGRGAGRYLLLLPHEGSLVCSLVLQHGLGGCTTLTGGGAVVVSARAPETAPPPKSDWLSGGGCVGQPEGAAYESDARGNACGGARERSCHVVDLGRVCAGDTGLNWI
jgi:hypothetical protein